MTLLLNAVVLISTGENSHRTTFYSKALQTYDFA